MRFRINLRDIFWYRHATASNNRIRSRIKNIVPAFRPPPDPYTGDPDSAGLAANSVTDT